ncbi:hypothetical protein Elgi_06750 [Paenibacillus elgii]|nr:hypothetical protein Elgi_06750 [Paenibacillus elgii]
MVIHTTQVLNEKAVLAALEQSLAMIEFNVQGEVLWANENFAHAMEYSLSELVGVHHRRFCTESPTNKRVAKHVRGIADPYRGRHNTQSTSGFGHYSVDGRE